MTIATAAVLVAVSSAPSPAEEPIVSASLVEPAEGPQDLSTALGSMFNPEKFTMNHGYTFSVLSDGGTSRTWGVYTNTVSYALTDPLRLDLRLDYLHDPSKVFKSGDNQSFDGRLLPSFSLIYKPSSSFMLRFDYLQGVHQPWSFPGGRWFEDR
jgi:outer membrane receptor protein involved in Fe transport